MADPELLVPHDPNTLPVCQEQHHIFSHSVCLPGFDYHQRPCACAGQLSAVRLQRLRELMAVTESFSRGGYLNGAEWSTCNVAQACGGKALVDAKGIKVWELSIEEA